jgi:hypothetical protein
MAKWPVCHTWTEWADQPTLHKPFDYWRWRPQNEQRSKERLGQRLYICSCLLWTALHDRDVATRLVSESPNSSAIAAYYSMVHALRLVWFVLYGSYPTGHSKMAMCLSREISDGEAPQFPDWARDQFACDANNSSRIARDALEGAIRDGLQRTDLANELPRVGQLFEKAIKLREDSNYESLILAHQYYHGSPGVDVADEMTKATTAMRSAADKVLTFVGNLVASSFQANDWYCPASAFSAEDLRNLMLGYVATTAGHSDQLQEGQTLLRWFGGLGDLTSTFEQRKAADRAMSLRTYAKYGVFDLKRGIMDYFRTKVSELQHALS